MAPMKKRELVISSAGLKKKRAKKERKSQAQSQAMVLYNRAIRSRSRPASTEAPAINLSSLRSASRPRLSSSIANLNGIQYNQEHVSPGNEPVIPRRASTPLEPRTPDRRTPERSSKQKTPVTQTGLLTPPSSGPSTKIQKSVKKTVREKKVSNFRKKLAAAYRAGNEEEVVITGTQINLSNRKRLHFWTAEERTVLCLVKRFFSADLCSLTAILNGVFPFPKPLVKFTTGMVNMQYIEIRAGKKCSIETDAVWSAVWDVSDFGQACQDFRLTLEEIEETAAEVRVPLRMRFDEDLRNLTYTENRKIALQNRPVRTKEAPNTGERMTMSEQALPSPAVSQQSEIGQSSQSVARSQSVSLLVAPFTEASANQDAVMQQDNDVPTLLFRAFSSFSAGINEEERFRAGQFMGRLNAVPPPPDPSDTRFAWDASNHLSQSHEIASKIATPFISLSPSLVWCVQKLYKMAGDDDSKKFAIIAGPLAEIHTRLYKVSPILQQLKNTDMYDKNVRYKASMEWFAWAEIQKEAISTVISRHHLERLSQASPAVKAVLRLDILEKTNNMSDARAEFKLHPVPLDGQSGMAIGKICLLFGISFHSDQAVITEVIFHILQGWAINIDVEDSEAMEQAFSTFIGQLEASDCSIILAAAISIMRPKLREAFYKAVQQAAQELLKENSKRVDRRRRYNRRGLYSRS